MSENTPAQAENTTQTGVSNETQNKTVDVAALDERAYHELIQSLDPKAIEAKPAEPVAKDNPQPETPAEQPEEAAQAQEPAKAEEAKEEPKDEEAKEEPKAEETPAPDPETLPERIRIGSWSEVERKALQIRARNPDLSLEQAIEMAKGKEQAEQAQEVPDLAKIEGTLDAKAKEKADAIKNLEFDNVFAYGKNNVINFDNLPGITGIFGRNRTGKSSIIGTIVYTLFNTSDRGAMKNLHIINTDAESCQG
ncbi:MAG: hypothetical protein EBU96_10295, partial [Actinobacteria bacterium]|nr:hypothetical protein [Actinomycetota bacterium]